MIDSCVCAVVNLRCVIPLTPDSIADSGSKWRNRQRLLLGYFGLIFLQWKEVETSSIFLPSMVRTINGTEYHIILIFSQLPQIWSRYSKDTENPQSWNHYGKHLLPLSGHWAFCRVYCLVLWHFTWPFKKHFLHLFCFRVLKFLPLGKIWHGQK